MSHPDADHDSVLADLLEAARAEIRSGSLDADAWRRRHPEIIDELLPLLETVRNLDTAVSDWKGLDTMAAADAEGGATVDAATAADHEPAESEPLPETIGRYRILERIGVGGMGTVYKAHDPQLDRIVAVKVPHFHSARKAAAALQRFLREARAAARVRHPHVCPIHDVGEQDGLPYVVMAYIDGQTLADRLRGGARFTDPRAAAMLVRQVAEALEAVHGHGIVHRDLKPGNILLEADGRAVLTDFGLARPEQDTENLTDEGVLVGTPAYMPVEQISPGNGTLGPWTDLYSLGVVLYQMLTGRLPYQAGTALDLLLKIGSEEPAPPAPCAGLDPALEALVLKMMARRPEDRYPNARALIEALDDWQRTRPAETAAASTATVPAAVPTGGAGSPLRPSRRRPLVAALVVLLLAPLGWFFGGTVIRFATDQGELVIEVDDKDIEVRVVRNGAVVTDRTTRREFTLRAGAGEVEVFEKDGVGPLATKKFTLNRGGRTVVRVTAELAAARRGAETKTRSDLALWLPAKSHVVVPTVRADGQQVRTLEAWILPGAAASAQENVVVLPNQFALQFEPKTRQVALYYKTDKAHFLKNVALFDGRPLHVAAVRTDREMLLFLGGRLAARQEHGGLPFEENQASFGIGSPAHKGYWFEGMVDEVRISKTARYDKDFTPEARFRPDAATIALYHCDEGSGDKLVDASGNGHHGMIFGARWVKADGSEVDGSPTAPEPAALTAEQRKALEWVLSVGGKLNVSVNGEGVLLNPGDRLPEGPFEVGILSLKRVKKAADIVERLRTVPPVQHTIDLSDTTIGDKEVQALAALPALRRTTFWGLGGTRVTDSALQPLGLLPSLHGGNFDRTAITDAGLKFLAASSSLMHLNLEKTVVTDAGLEHLAAPKWWNTLNVKGTKVTAAGVEKLARAVPRLRIHWDGGVIEPTTPADPDRRAAEALSLYAGLHLRLDSGRTVYVAPQDPLPDEPFAVTQVSLHFEGELPGAWTQDVLVPALTPLRSLTGVFARHRDVPCSEADLIKLAASPSRNEWTTFCLRLPLTPTAIDVLKRFPRLAQVDFVAAEANDEMLVRLAELKAVRDLRLHDLGRAGKVGDKGKNAIVALPLEKLSFNHLPLDASFARRLAAMPTLQTLGVGATRYLDGAVAELAKSRTLTTLGLGYTNVDDADLELLRDMKPLRVLQVIRTKVTAGGVKKLAAARPDLRIEWDGGVIQPTIPADPDRRAAEWVLAMGGIVGVRVQGVLRGGIKDADRLPRERFELVEVNLGQNPSVDDERLAHLSECRNLEKLNLYNSNRITDAGLAHLKGCGNLTLLNLFNCHRVTDAGLKQLADLTKLTYLHLTQTRVSDAGLVHLRQLKNLTVLHLHSTLVSEEGIARLADLENLSELHPPNLSDAGLVRLKAFKNLTKLGLRFNTKVSDAGLAHLKDFKNLAFLSLEDTNLSDAGLVHLKDCQNLRELRVQKTMITAAMIEELHKALPQCRILWDGGVVEPTGTSRSAASWWWPRCSVHATAGTASAG